MRFIAALIMFATLFGTAACGPEEALPPCPTEDSDNCYWDATTRGNGEGRSFVVRDGIVTYVD